MKKVLFTAMMMLCFAVLSHAVEPLMHFSFDEGSGTAASGGTISGTITGTQWVSGAVGKALLFNGKSSVAVKSTDELNAAPLSIALWLKSTAADQNDKQLIAKTSSGKDGYRIKIDGNRITWQIPSADKPWGILLTASTGLNTGEWNHVVCTYDGSEMRIFINGVEAGTLARPGTIAPSKANLTIGAFDASGTAGFSGFIDEVMVFAKALSADDAASQYADGCAKIAAQADASKKKISAVTPKAEVTVTVTSGMQPIHMISGSQFEMFQSGIRQRMKSDDLLRTWKSVPIRMLRYPGGTVCDHYIWNDPKSGYFSVGSADTIIKPDDFMRICGAIGSEAIFQVNTLSVDRTANRINPNDIEAIRLGAKRAAEWVYDANIKNKWNVKYWEIGNEVWIWLFGKEYARYVVEYAKAMRAVDPSIKIIACGLSEKTRVFDPSSWLDFSKSDPSWKPRTAVSNTPAEWYDALFTIAAGSFDYIAPHPYVSSTNDSGDAKQKYLETTVKLWKNEKMHTQYASIEKYSSPARIAVTEWACNFGYSVPGGSGKVKPEQGYYYMLGNGINMAYYFGRLLEDARNEIAVAHSLGDMQTLWYWTRKELAKGEPLEHPAMLGLRVWGNHTGTMRAAVRTSGMPMLSIDGEQIPAVYLFASEDATNRYLVAINLDSDNANRVRWQTKASQAAVSLMFGDALDTQNFAGWNEAVKPVSIEKYTVSSSGGALNIDLPKHSMAGITIRK
ncbi:MAG: hypothetical protein HZC28_02640 [Spirochaetes bacterium]|nr:hypothetical protein [Spirochaetota bacterium]